MRKTTRELRARIDPGEEMAEKRFRDSEGNLLCDRCHGPIVQPSTGRRRLYCGRTCRELAYRERSRQAAIDEAVKAATAPVSSVVETRPDPVTSVDETRVPRPSRRRAGMTTGALVVPYDD
jgi:hypothetical protein